METLKSGRISQALSILCQGTAPPVLAPVLHAVLIPRGIRWWNDRIIPAYVGREITAIPRLLGKHFCQALFELLQNVFQRI